MILLKYPFTPRVDFEFVDTWAKIKYPTLTHARLWFNILSSESAEDRNNLEKLTLAVLSHLPTAVLFVHDLSGECGTSPSDQVSLRFSSF